MEFKKTKLNTLKRGLKKANYDRDVIHSILDANEICNVAFNIEGRAHVQPINFGRCGEFLYLHSSLKNRMTTALIDSGEITLSVMVLDAIKLTRSAYKHSVNFRSAIIFGKVRELESNEEKLNGLKAIINHFVPERWNHCRHPNLKELNSTRVIEIEIESASAKISDNPPEDKNEDYDLDFWSGTIPVKMICEYPVADEKLKPGVEIPPHVLARVSDQNTG